MILTLDLAVYAGAALLIGMTYAVARRRFDRRSHAIREEAIAAGLTEPPSLHPVVDTLRCIGCGACMSACPEKGVLGRINGKAALIGPSHCIGHGACRAACPVNAITLVFGTETRGIDLPMVDEDFQTNMPGIFVAGELGGMGLIRNAIEQGRQAVDSIQKQINGSAGGDNLDLVIVGAGPAGFSASLAAKAHKLHSATLEQDTLGGTVAHYPRGKLVMTAPANLPIYGLVKLKETTKEALLSLWQTVEKKTDLKINYQERVERIEQGDQGYRVITTRGQYATKAVLLTIGRRGTPRMLEVPGEELPKVVYRLIDAEQYRGQHVLVVGGGDSALEAAGSISDQPGTTVALSYRSKAFGRAKLKNRERVDAAAATGRLTVMLGSTVKRVTPDSVEIEQGDGTIQTLRNDAIIVCAGGILPTGFLKEAGITIETKHGTA